MLVLPEEAPPLLVTETGDRGCCRPWGIDRKLLDSSGFFWVQPDFRLPEDWELVRRDVVLPAGLGQSTRGRDLPVELREWALKRKKKMLKRGLSINVNNFKKWKGVTLKNYIRQNRPSKDQRGLENATLSRPNPMPKTIRSWCLPTAGTDILFFVCERHFI